MAQNIQDAVNAVNAFAAKIETLRIETTNANSRFETKLALLQAQIADLQAQVAASVDTTPIVNVLTNLGANVDNQIAAEQISGS